MLPKLMTDSLFFALSANCAPCGLTYPRLRAIVEPENERELDERVDNVDEEEVSEKSPYNGGQESLAGNGLTERDLGDDIIGMLFKGGDADGDNGLLPISAEETACRSFERGDSPVEAVVAMVGS